MTAVEFERVRKAFGRARNATHAVDDVTWRAEPGQVFGVLGPNGAGKTTMIRMLLDILRPDAGTIRVDGVPAGNQAPAFKHRVGYLPEERGLYRKRKVMDVLVYLAALKGVGAATARRRAAAWLERFGLADTARRKIETLSKGMSQKLQILSCILHEPDLVVLDEPFSGLDPVNVRLVRDVIRQLAAGGALVFLSTHMMAEVEVLCDRVLMMHRGRQLLCGTLAEIKRAYTDFDAVVDRDAAPEGLACVERVVAAATGKQIHLRAGRTIVDLMREMGAAGRPVRRLEEGAKPLEDIFVSIVGSHAEEPPAEPPRERAA